MRDVICLIIVMVYVLLVGAGLLILQLCLADALFGQMGIRAVLMTWGAVFIVGIPSVVLLEKRWR